MNGKTVSAQARVEGVNHSITHPRGGRSVFGSPVKGNATRVAIR
jgi:hypothetical protein